MSNFKNITRPFGKRLSLFAALVFCACTQLPEYCGDGNNSFNPNKQFCFDNKPYDKCGGKEYDPRTHGCAAGEVKQTVTTFKVTVSGNATASGGGDFALGATVRIDAGTPPAGQQFKNWTASSADVNFNDANSSITTFTMPANNVTVTAIFQTAGTPGTPDSGTSGQGTITDTRNGKIYGTVKIGGKTWMTKNVDYQPPTGPNTGNSWCYENSADSCNKYGRLYDWAAAMDINKSYNNGVYSGGDVNHRGICPAGWHLPSRAEWDLLAESVGGQKESGTYYDWLYAGKELKSTTGWYGNGNGADNYGFTALPSGSCSYNGINTNFRDVGSSGNWWTATGGGNSDAYGKSMSYQSDDVIAYSSYAKSSGYSVRCVQND